MRLLLSGILSVLLAPIVAAEPLAFINVNVVPMSSELVLRQQTVLIDGDRIVAIGDVDEVPIPEQATLIDGTDRYLAPGLAEMHAHVPDAPSDDLDRYMALYVANGVTTIRGMLGRPSHLPLRESLSQGEVFGPRLITSGPSLNGRSVNGVAEAQRMVEEQHAAGYDFIKLHPGLSADEFEAIATAANRLGMPFAGHVPVAAGVRRALQLGMATIDHLDGYFAALLPPDSIGEGGYGGFFDILLADDIDAGELRDIAEATAAAGTWNVVTEVLVEQLVNDTPAAELRHRPDMRYMPAETIRSWVRAKQEQQAEKGFNADIAARGIEMRRRLILELHRAGAGLLLGADSPQVFNVPGFATHYELGALVASGLTPYEALRAGTVAVAAFLESNGGVIAVGHDADLVLLDANPLADIGNSRRIHGVVLRGTWYSAADLEERLEPFRQDRERD
jgi:imidazolonepropionase-like amidohydrolase